MLRLRKPRIYRVLSSSGLPNRLRRIPERVRRPAGAQEALGFSPLVQASGAHASGVECVPLMASGAKPFIFLAGRPATSGFAIAARQR
jgi:hypothetical protein